MPTDKIEYRHRVDKDGVRPGRLLYDGTDAADAMAAWSKAIQDGVRYVTLESLRELPVTDG